MIGEGPGLWPVVLLMRLALFSVVQAVVLGVETLESQGSLQKLLPAVHPLGIFRRRSGGYPRSQYRPKCHLLDCFDR